MRDYILRRLLLLIPTMFGITLMIFTITRLVPGGPLEQALAEAQSMDAGGSRGGGSDMALSEDQLQQLKEYYGFDKPILVSYFDWLGKVLRGDFGNSLRYQDPVLGMILDRVPIAVYFGGVTLLISYLVSIPLGIFKALRHRKPSDNVTSILVFSGYAVPGYALGALLVVFVCLRWGWFAANGWPEDDFSSMSFTEKIADLYDHTAMPLLCYIIGMFAFKSMLMKNQLMDNLAADYVRTAVAKGLSFRQAVTRHAMRNSLIPIATTLGQMITIFVGGSFLIEVVFDIDGIGLLGFKSLVDRDYTVVMGILTISALLMLLGNLLSDIIVASVDPRVKFK